MFLAALSVIVWLFATRSDRRLEEAAFLGASLTHVLSDMLPAALAGRWAELGALLWPITPVYQYPDELDRSIIGFFLELEPAVLVSFELGITIVAVALWIVDGTPGSGTVVRGVQRF